MKKILSLLAIMLLAIAATFGQSPSPGIFNYQGVARNSVGNALVNKTITLRLTIRDGAAAGPLLYQESRTVTTNPFGLFNVQVGSGGTITQVGTIAGVNWGVNTKFIQVEIDPNGGSSFINIGAAQIASVPYSLYSSLANDLVLPFNKTQADNGALFRIVNSGNNTGSTALEGLTNSTQANAAAIIGTVTNTSPGGFSTGVRGINNGIGGLGIGVWGSQNGSGYGVYGTTPAGWAIRGEAATTGVGVYGSSNSGTGGRFLSTTGLALHTSGGGVRLQNINEAANRILATIPGDGTATWQDPAAVGIVTGSGTLNFVPKWTPNGTNLGNSQIFDNGTSVGINTTTPNAAYRLEVQGLQRINATTNQEGGELRFQEGNLFGPQNHWIIDNFLSFAGGNKFRIWNDVGGMNLQMLPNNRTAIGNMVFSDQPQSTLDVEGNLAVGAAYSGTTAAPANGAIIQGNVGIGTSAPVARLHVGGGSGVGIYSNFTIDGNTTFTGVNINPNAAGAITSLNYGLFGAPNNWNASAFFASVGGFTDHYIVSTDASGNTPDFSINRTSKNIGIGRVSAGAKLHVQGSQDLGVTLGAVNFPHQTLIAQAGAATTNVSRSMIAYANNSSIENHGLFTYPGSTTGWNVGVFSFAVTGTAGRNYGYYTNTQGGALGNIGIQSNVPLGANNWAGIFNGRVAIVDGTQGLNKVFASDAAGNGSWQTLAAIGGVTGTGTLNFVTKWTPNGTNIGNSQIFDDGNTVSISGGGFTANNSVSVMTSPASPTNTTLSLITASQAAGVYLENGTGDLHVTANFNDVGIGDKIMTFEDGSLNVGIGTTAPAAKLHAVSAPASGGPDAILGESNNTAVSAVAIRGVITSASPGGFSSALRGINNGTGGLGIGVYGSQNGSGWGVYGTAPSGLGVLGATTSGTGVWGTAVSGTGVFGVSSTGFAGNFENTNAANATSALRGFNAAANVGSRGISAFSVNPAGTGFPGEATHAALVAAATTGVGIVTSSPTNYGLHAGSAGNHAIFAQQYGPTNAAVFGQGLAANSFGISGNAAAGTGAGGYFTGGTTALRTLGGVQLTGINEGVNRILATVPGTGQATWEDPSTVGIVSGSGTLNFISKWTPNGTTLGNSQLFDNGVNVGIGTVTPAAKLHLFHANNVAEIIQVGGAAAANDAGLILNKATNAQETYIQFGSPANAWIQTTFFGNNMSLYNSATATNAWWVNTSNNHMGINDNAPTARLQVSDNSVVGVPQIMANENDDDFARISLRNTNANNSTNNFWDIAAYTNDVTANERLNFWNNASGNLMSITGAGDVGIGTTNPGGKLNVDNPLGLNHSVLVNHTNAASVSNGITVNATNPTGNGFGQANAINANRWVSGPTAGWWTAPTTVQVITGTGMIGIQSSNDNNFSIAGNTITGTGVLGLVTGASGTGLSGLAFSPTAYALVTSGRVQIQGQGAAVNRILTSDAVGNATWQDASAVGIVSGSGTLNYLPKWTPNGVTLGNSLIFDDGVNLGIGTITPVAGLDINNAAVGKGAVRVNQDNDLLIPAIKSLSDGPVINDLSLLGANWGDNSIFAQRGSRLAGTTYGISGPGAIAGYSQDFTAVKAMSTNGAGIFASSSTSNGVRAFSFSGNAIRSTTGTGLSLYTTGNIRLDGIGESNGYILTSDGAGNATWQENTSSSIGISSHYFTGSLTIPSAVFTPITQWDNLLEDGGANYNAGTGEYTITKTGVYQVNVNVLWDPFTATAPVVIGALFVNGFSTGTHQAVHHANSGQYSTTTMAISQRFVAGDILQVNLYQNSGSNQTITASYYANSMSIQFVHK